MSNDIRISNPNGLDIYEALSINKAPAEQPAAKELPQTNTTITSDTQNTGNVQQGNIPASNIALSEELPPLADINLQNNGEPLQSLDEVAYQQLMNEDFPDLTTLLPEADPNYLPPLSEFSVMHQGRPEEGKHETGHLAEKSLYHLYVGIGSKGIGKYATSKIAKITEKEVNMALTKVIEGATTSTRATGTVATRITDGAAKGIEKTIETLAKEGKLGKGILTPTIKEISKESGNIIKGMKASYTGGAEVLAKTAAEHGVIKSIPKALQKTAVGAGEKVLAEGIGKGAAKGVENALLKAGAEATEKLTAKTLEKAATVATVEATTKVAAKGGVRFATGLAKAAPYIGTAANIGITAYDIHDAIQKTRDENASGASKALAWTTVGLDVASTVAMTTGKGRPVGWAAAGLSIGTSLLSDIVR